MTCDGKVMVVDAASLRAIGQGQRVEIVEADARFGRGPFVDVPGVEMPDGQYVVMALPPKFDEYVRDYDQFVGRMALLRGFLGWRA